MKPPIILNSTMLYVLLSSSNKLASCASLNPKLKHEVQEKKPYTIETGEADISKMTIEELENMVEEVQRELKLLKLVIHLKNENMKLKKMLNSSANLRNGGGKESEVSSGESETDNLIEIRHIGRPRTARKIIEPKKGEDVDEPNEDERPNGKVVSRSIYTVDDGDKRDTIIVEEYKKRRVSKIPIISNEKQF